MVTRADPDIEEEVGGGGGGQTWGANMELGVVRPCGARRAHNYLAHMTHSVGGLMGHVPPGNFLPYGSASEAVGDHHNHMATGL